MNMDFVFCFYRSDISSRFLSNIDSIVFALNWVRSKYDASNFGSAFACLFLDLKPISVYVLDLAFFVGNKTRVNWNGLQIIEKRSEIL